MPKNIDKYDYTTRFVVRIKADPKLEGDTDMIEEKLGYGMEGNVEIIRWYFTLVERHGKDRVELLSNERYVPVAHAALAYQAAMSIMGCVTGIKKAFEEIDSKVIAPETAKLEVLMKAYRTKPTEKEVVGFLEKVGIDIGHQWHADLKKAILGEK